MLRRNNGLQCRTEGICSVIHMSGTSCRVVNKTSLLKVSAANVRKAANDEKDGVELIERYLPSLREEFLQRRRRRGYWDLTHEQPLPLEEGEEDEAAPQDQTGSQQSTGTPESSRTPGSANTSRSSSKRPAERSIEDIDEVSGNRARGSADDASDDDAAPRVEGGERIKGHSGVDAAAPGAARSPVQRAQGRAVHERSLGGLHSIEADAEEAQLAGLRQEAGR